MAVGLLFFEAVFAGWEGVPIKPSVLANREPKVEIFTAKALANFEVRVAYVEHAILALPSGYRAGVDPTTGQRVKEYKRLVAVDEAYGPPDKPPSKYRTDIFHLTEMPEEGLYKLKVKGQVDVPYFRVTVVNYDEMMAPISRVISPYFLVQSSQIRTIRIVYRYDENQIRFEID